MTDKCHTHARHNHACPICARVRADRDAREIATGVITYRENGQEKQWSIGCMAWETPKHLKNHLATWKPKAEFVRGEIIPNKRKAKR